MSACKPKVTSTVSCFSALHSLVPYAAPSFALIALSCSVAPDHCTRCVELLWAHREFGDRDSQLACRAHASTSGRSGL